MDGGTDGQTERKVHLLSCALQLKSKNMMGISISELTLPCVKHLLNYFKKVFEK